GFALRQTAGPPRHQEAGQVHEALLSGPSGYPRIVVRSPSNFQIPFSISPRSRPRLGVPPAVAWSNTHVDIAELKRKSVAELHAMAETLNISNYSGLRKQDLIFRIEQSLLDSDTVLRGEGVLEIL